MHMSATFMHLTACILALGVQGMAADGPLLLPPLSGYAVGESPALRYVPNGETLSVQAGLSVTRSLSVRRSAEADLGLTTQRRRWQNLAASSGATPMTWGLAGDVAAQLSVGLQPELFYTDNIKYAANSAAVGATVFELTPIIRLDIGDPQEGAMSAGKLSKYYAGLLYVPTVRQLLEEGEQKILQHFFGEVGRLTDISRISLRLDYDERILASSDNTSLEDNYTLLESSGLFDYHFTPKTMLHSRVTYRGITVEDGTADRTLWIGEAGLEWVATAKTTLGMGTEWGVIDFTGGGGQSYQQALMMSRWKPTAKLNVSARAGMEWREFTGTVPHDMKISPVGAVAMQWLATEKTRISARLRTGNEASVVQQGALFREYSIGAEVVHDFSDQWYGSGAAQFVRRNFNTSQRETEPSTRLVLGYRESPDRTMSQMNVELYFQWRQRQRHGNFEAADRSQIGIQVTKFF